MEYTDKIYGRIEITEPVIQELIESEPMQRLKDVNQYGAAAYRFPHLNTNRFEHSVGVWYVLHRLGASVSEQIVGLLHDTPHTAFSHVSDVVFDDTTEAFHDKFLEKIVFSSDIPKILKKHGLSVWKILDKKAFPLAERDLPDLCADRIDYFFRDCVTDKQLDLRDARLILDDMTVHEGEIAFQNLERAKQMAMTYAGANEQMWAHPLQAALYSLLAKALKLSLEEGLVTFDDLFTTDKQVYETMRNSGNPEITKLLEDVEHIVIKEDDEDYDYHFKPKIRVVDPWVIVDGGLKRVSELDQEAAEHIQGVRNRMSEGYFVKVVRD